MLHLLHTAGVQNGQDLTFALGSLVFISALIKMVRTPEKPPVASSLSTGLVLATYLWVYISYHLLYSLVTGAVTAVLWVTLAVQRWRADRLTELAQS